MNSRYAVIENGTVTNIIVWDGETVFSAGDNQLFMPIQDNAGIGWSWSDDGGVFIPPPAPKKTPEQLVAEAKAEKQTRLDFATTKIVVWQTKLLMGRKLTDEESTQLNAWMDYIDAVTATDTSTAPDVIWPELPES